jgi:regulator of RNase E activity RraB
MNILHQNIRGLRNNSDELINALVLDNINPHILCLSEHHMEEQDLLNRTLDWLFPGFQLLSLKPTERRSVCFCQ